MEDKHLAKAIDLLEYREEQTDFHSPYDNELNIDCGISHFRFSDELPAFTIQSLSPSGESLSSIGDDDDTDYSLIDFSASPNESSLSEASSDNVNYADFSNDRISLADINDRIAKGTSEPDNFTHDENNKRLLLETIHEGVFLETPPKNKCNALTWYQKSPLALVRPKRRKFILDASDTDKNFMEKFDHQLQLSSNI